MFLHFFFLAYIAYPIIKTISVIRVANTPPFLADYLKMYLPTLTGTYLFATAKKDKMTHSSYVKMWERICRAIQQSANVNKIALTERITAHMFRHNFCSNLCYQIPKISIKRIAQLMGDTEKVVLDVYNHILLDKEDATGAVENAMESI